MAVPQSTDSSYFKERDEVLSMVKMEAAHSTDFEEGKETLNAVEMEATDSYDSEDGRTVKEKVTILEMKTFSSNLRSFSQFDCLEETTEEDPLKIVCVGGSTGMVRSTSKGDFIKDYLGITPAFRIHPFNSIDFYLKRVKWRRHENMKSNYSIILQLSEISDMQRFSAMTKVFFQHSQGALVFWGPRDPMSLAEAVQWRTKIRQEVCSSIPCVLVAENVPDSSVNSVKWIGPGKIFESELSLDQFCKDHGFVDHFEIKSRDWESGENSVFGQAVNCLLDEILQSNEKDDKTWM